MQIMQDWQKQRFVILTGLITDIGVLLSDYKYWTDNADKLTEWCENNNCRQEGMVVVFPDEQSLILFCLRWT